MDLGRAEGDRRAHAQYCGLTQDEDNDRGHKSCISRIYASFRNTQ